MTDDIISANPKNKSFLRSNLANCNPSLLQSSHEDDVSGIEDHNISNNRSKSFKDLFLMIPDEQFYALLRIRLKLPVLEESKQIHVEEEREYYVDSYIIEQLFNELSRTVEVVTIKGREIKVKKYYSRAQRVFKFANITKQESVFVIDISDLSPRIVAELKILNKTATDYVLKQAVGGIFEKINSKRYHTMGFANRLNVRLDR